MALQAGITGLQSGLLAARRVYDDPATAHQQRTFLMRAEEYALLWAYYDNSMFDRTAFLLNTFNSLGSFNSFNISYGLSHYKSTYNLYRNTRLIYNPVRRLVEFYAGQLYPGVLSEDGNTLPDGIPQAIPFSEDTPKPLKDAVAQLWQWSNWQARKSVQVRYGGALGSLLVEIVDDVEHGKVATELVWPGFVVALDLDTASNVKAYALEYRVTDAEAGNYVYRKEVDQDAFRYYKDGEPFDYGSGSVVENPYGFVPAAWVKHTDVGGDHGSPAIAGSLGKIDELNSLASHVHDQVHKKIGAPFVMWADGIVGKLFGTQNRGATSSMDVPEADQESVLMLKGPAGGTVESLAGDLNLADAAVYMDKLLGEIEQDHPELAFYRELRAMSQVTGPAASRLVGDVASRVTETMANYDQANIRLFQMAVAMAGFRANSGAWGPLTPQQQKFLPFGLESYQKGDLTMVIMPRPLLVPTKAEIVQEKTAMWTGVHMAVAAGVPLEFVLADEGFTDEELAELKQLKDAADQAAQAAQDKALQLAQAKAQQQQPQNQPPNQQQLPPQMAQKG